MPEHIKYEDDDLFNAETHHEHSDVPVRPLWWAVGIFIVFAIVTHIALGFLYKGFSKAENKRMEPPQTAVPLPPDAMTPKGQPLLQPFPLRDTSPQHQTPVSDLIAMRAGEEEKLHHYGWVDKQHGVARIPIDRAKDLLVQRGGTP